MSAVDDPTCHECIIACTLRAERDAAVAENDRLLAEVARLKGHSVPAERVAHGHKATP